MILENKTEVTVPAVMAMPKGNESARAACRYLIARTFFAGCNLANRLFNDTWNMDTKLFLWDFILCTGCRIFADYAHLEQQKSIEASYPAALQFVCTAHQSLLFSAADAENSG